MPLGMAKKNSAGEFSGSPVVRTPYFHFRTVGGMGSIPHWGNKILQMPCWAAKKKKKIESTLPPLLNYKETA